VWEERIASVKAHRENVRQAAELACLAPLY